MNGFPGFVLRRALGAVVTLFAISVIIYVVFYVAPGNVAQITCGPRCSPAQVHQVELGAVPERVAREVRREHLVEVAVAIQAGRLPPHPVAEQRRVHRGGVVGVELDLVDATLEPVDPAGGG